MMKNIVNYMGSKVVVLNVDGCASILGFKDVVGKTMKLVKNSGR